MERVEERQLLAAGPQVKSIFADNRGEIVVSFDRPVMRGSISNQSVQIFQIGRDGSRAKRTPTVSFNAKKNQLTARARVKANASYEIRLIANQIRGLDGSSLDGEFRGGKKESGNGEEGGNYIVRTKTRKTQIARYSTDLGIMDVRLFREETPRTVRNFLAYTNNGEYDGTFFHRSVASFVIQGGGFEVVNNKVTEIKDRPRVMNEPLPGDPGNVTGTIAMARMNDNNSATTDDINSATNEWFFNLDDNRGVSPNGLDFQNNGFTVFGEIDADDARSLRVMTAIGGRGRVDASTINSALGELPVEDKAKVDAEGLFAADLIAVRRIAIQVSVVAPPTGGRGSRAAKIAGDSSKISEQAFSQIRVADDGMNSVAMEEDVDGVWSDEDLAVL